MIKNLIESETNGQEILLIYGITILKGETITFNYKSNGYLNSFKDLDYINKINNHDIIEEAFLKIKSSKKNLFPVINKNHLDIPTLHYYLSRINLNGSCEFYINFYFENKEAYDFSFLNSLNYNSTELIQECNNISYGINSQGITVAIDSLIDAIIFNYNEYSSFSDFSIIFLLIAFSIIFGNNISLYPYFSLNLLNNSSLALPSDCVSI